MAGADHALDDPTLVNAVDLTGAYAMAVPEHADAIAYIKHVVEEVADEHERGAILAHAPQQREKPLNLRRR